jgi:hypothetical protein
MKKILLLIPIIFLLAGCGNNGSLGGRISSDSQPRYNISAPTYTNGQTATLQVDVNGNLKTVLATAIAGEDFTADVLKTEQRYSKSYATADKLVKTGSGFVHSVSFFPTDAAATAGSIIMYDSTTEGTDDVVFSYYIPAAALVPVTVILDVTMATGTYIGYTTTADVNTIISYR